MSDDVTKLQERIAYLEGEVKMLRTINRELTFALHESDEDFDAFQKRWDALDAARPA